MQKMRKRHRSRWEERDDEREKKREKECECILGSQTKERDRETRLQETESAIQTVRKRQMGDSSNLEMMKKNGKVW